MVAVILLVLVTWFNWFVIVTSVAGLMVTYYSVLEGIFMLWDKFRHGIPVFWVP